MTGGSGFIGSHCVAQLLDRGHRVRTTVRSDRGAAAVRALFGDAVEIAHADLLADTGWAEAAAGCDYVLHVASPFPATVPKDADDLIVPAREGTLRVLRAADRANVRRTVVTSSFAAIAYGHPDPGRVFDESDWSTEPLMPYLASKLRAERAAWDHAARTGRELAVVNPVEVFGPPLGPDYSPFVEVIEQLLNGRFPALPRLDFNVVDVRDVADLHLRAMLDPAAAGERFLAIGGRLPLTEVAAVLRDRLGPAARRVPLRTLPDWVVRLAGRLDSRFAQIVPDIGVVRTGSNRKARDMLGWKPRPIEDTLADTGTALATLGRLRR